MCQARSQASCAGRQQLLRERIVVAEQAGGDVAERDDAGAGERGDVDHRVGLEPLRSR